MSEHPNPDEVEAPPDARPEADAREVESPTPVDPAPPTAISAEPQRLGALPEPLPLPSAGGLNTHARLTLLFLVAVTLVAASAWGAGKVACNYHPQSSEKFNPDPFVNRVRRPKDAALEFHHQLFLQDYDQALKLVAKDGVDIVERRRDGCEAACQGERERRVAEANTRAVLHRVRGLTAWATAETFFEGRVVREDYVLERIDRAWRVVGVGTPPHSPR